MSNTTDAEIDELFETLDEAYTRHFTGADSYLLEDALDQAKAKLSALLLRERQTVLNELKYKQSKHFTSWGGKQGNCIPEDVIEAELSRLNGEDKQ